MLNNSIAPWLNTQYNSDSSTEFYIIQKQCRVCSDPPAVQQSWEDSRFNKGC